ICTTHTKEPTRIRPYQRDNETHKTRTQHLHANTIRTIIHSIIPPGRPPHSRTKTMRTQPPIPTDQHHTHTTRIYSETTYLPTQILRPSRESNDHKPSHLSKPNCSANDRSQTDQTNI